MIKTVRQPLSQKMFPWKCTRVQPTGRIERETARGRQDRVPHPIDCKKQFSGNSNKGPSLETIFISFFHFINSPLYEREKAYQESNSRANKGTNNGNFATVFNRVFPMGSFGDGVKLCACNTKEVNLTGEFRPGVGKFSA